MSWKQYGGIYRTDKYHNVNMGTLVADQLVLRQTASTKLTFDSSILVKQNIGCEGNVDVCGNIMGDTLFAKKNMYIKNKLYFGTTTTYDDTNESACYIYGNSSGIGINTKTPSSPFDVTATDSIANVLTVRSQAATNTNIIAQNNTLKGIIVNASGDSCFIGFFNDTNTSFSNIPDSKIQYNTGGVLETISNTVKLSSNVYVLNRGTRSGISNSIFDEPMIIYDSSQNNYLYQYYQNTSVKSGTGLSLVALDNSSNTFLRITTPNKLGLSIGGGANPKNNSLPMGTIGITDSSGNYYQNQMFSRGTDLIKNKTTLGINTFSPKTNNYALDINGVTRISNGEINTMTDLNYEVKKISFSRTYPLNGIAVGTSDSINSPYSQKISYTIDGGKSWNISNINNNNLQITTHDFTVNYYDLSYALIGTSNSFVFYTRDKGINWNTVTLASDNLIRDIKTIYISNYITTNGNRIFFAGLVGASVGAATPTIPTIFYYDINISNVLNGTDINIATSYNNTSLANSNFIIKNSDGYGNFIYFVGNGIQKINITTTPPTSLYYIKTGQQYNSIYAYDNNNVFAVGLNIISYTRNGTDWTDISFTNITFNDVFMYDINSVVAVGNNGSFYYTSNGTTWTSVPDTILNSSGISYLITNPNYKLNNIIMPNKDSYIISSIVNPYNQNSSLGRTKILYGYYPNLLNRSNNTVLEISGNIVVSGDIEINDTGKLKTKQSTFNLLTENVETMYIANSSSNINIGNNATNTNIIGKLNVNNDTTLNSKVYAGGAVELNSTLDVTGNSNLKQNLYVVGDTSLNSKVYAGGAVILNSTLDVTGNSNLKQNLYVVGDTSLNSKVYAGGAVTLNSTLDITGNSNLKQNLYVLGDTSLNSKVNVAGDVTMNSKLIVSDSATLNSTLNIIGNTTMNNRLTVSNDTGLNSKLVVQGDVSLNSNLTVINNALFKSRLAVDNDVSLNNNLTVNQTIYNSGIFKTNNIELYSNENINIGSAYINNITTKNINIGYNVNNIKNKNIITIGSDVSNDIIYIKGQLINQGSFITGTQQTLDLTSPTLQLNGGKVGPGQGKGSGILIRDNDVSNSGFIILNNTESGYLIKPSVLNSNVLNMEVNSMILNSQTNTGLIVLKRLPDFSDASFSMLVENLDTSSILLRSTTSTSSNQIIDTKLTLNNDASLNLNLFVNGTTTLNNNLITNADVSMNARLFVNEDSSLNNVNIRGITTTNNKFITNDDVSMNARLFVNGDSSLNNVNIQGTTTMNNILITNADVSMNARLFVDGDSSLNNVNIQGTTTMNNILITNADVSMNARLFVNGDSSLNNVNIRGITTTNNKFITNADVSMNAGLTVNGDSSLNNVRTNNLSSITALLNKLGIGINNISPNISLDVSGNFRLTNGVVVQFYE
jgi:hypothetical protein